ncbi:MAG: polyphenol oxidase family protein [Collinsella sp.]|nr:polyphenol oxidase family protein [Collinsella sp.]
MQRHTIDGITFTGDLEGAVRFGFTERTGGVSLSPYASLNLGMNVGDDPEAVRENRRRALAALGAGTLIDELVVPSQVHGDHIVLVDSADPLDLARARSEARDGADAVVCTVPGIPVLLCFADCVPVILTLGDRGFAVVHSGWRGTYARIAAKAARVLASAVGASTSEIKAYIGPHILGDEYEVSTKLLHKFSLEFANIRRSDDRLLDLSSAIRLSLEESGVPRCEIHDPLLSTMRQNERFFSYRKENGICGRHGAIAYLS